MARTEQWIREKLTSEPDSLCTHHRKNTDDDELLFSLPEIIPLTTTNRRNLKQDNHLFELSNQEYQVTEMLDTYATSGNDGGSGSLMLLKWTYDVLLGIYLFFTLWGYVAGKQLLIHICCVVVIVVVIVTMVDMYLCILI